MSLDAKSLYTYCKQAPPNGYADKPIKKGDLAKFKPWMQPYSSEKHGVFIVLKTRKDFEDRVYFKSILGTLRATAATNVMLVSAAPTGE